MVRQLAILVLVLKISLSSCAQKQVDNKARILSSPSLQVDTSVIAILPFNTAQYWIFKDCIPVALTNADLAKIEKILSECLDNYNREQERQHKDLKSKNTSLVIDKKDFVIDLTNYKRQYFTVKNNKGEKEVWVNCFCNTGDKNWREELIFVKDGGNCYFSLKINLAKGEYYELMVNGDA